MMYSPYQYNGTTASSWQYTLYEIVRLHGLERFHLESFCNSFVTGNGLHKSVHQEENFWKSNGYGSSFQELRHSSYENHVQRWDSTFGNCFNQLSHPYHNQIEARKEKLTVEPVIALFLKNRFFYLPLEQNTYRKYGFNPEVLKTLPEEYPKYFEKYGNLLFLKPKIKICEAHTLGEGCFEWGMCCDIHLCMDLILSECHDHNCKFGHNWKTDHNLKVFACFYMNVKRVSLSYLKALLCDKIFSLKSPNELQLCSEYDARGCTNIKCLKLHICFKYLSTQFEGNFTQNSCDLDYIFPKCMKSHDIKSNHNKRILIIHDLNINDTPWNLIKKINKIVHLKKTDAFPAYWRKMYTCSMQLFIRVPLDRYSEEFQKIKFQFESEKLIYRIINIERIQNPFLWKAFCNKVEEMTAIYRNEEYVNIQHLYHGTKEYLVNKICAENFDWRLHGCNVGTAYGKGAYFSPYARIAANYCEKSSSRPHKYIFLVRVAVGQICVGNHKMTRPPTSPFTNLNFDSTCDQLLNPKRIVKYDKQEYYPEYILTIENKTL